MDVLATILEWSADKPDWQRDALRRLVTDGPLSEANFDELTLLCESRHGLHEDVPFEPLERSHLSLAAFFAELSTADDPSAILFDDPVSSLDHKWQRALAQRLVEPASEIANRDPSSKIAPRRSAAAKIQGTDNLVRCDQADRTRKDRTGTIPVHRPV